MYARIPNNFPELFVFLFFHILPSFLKHIRPVLFKSCTVVQLLPKKTYWILGTVIIVQFLCNF